MVHDLYYSWQLFERAFWLLWIQQLLLTVDTLASKRGRRQGKELVIRVDLLFFVAV